MSRREMRITCRRAEVLLDAYLDGDLARPRRVALEQHLTGCFACSEELARARRIRDGLRALPERFLGDHVSAAVMARVRNTASAPRPQRGLGLGARLQRRFVPLWQPIAAVAAVALVVLGVMHMLTRPPVEQTITPGDVARAETQVRWVMAHLGNITRQTGERVRDDVLDKGVVAPATRAVENALESNPRQ
jgi:anti-sigma factor RsiW